MNYFEAIQQIVCYGETLLPNQVKEKTRKREVVFCRQLIMYFMKQYTKDSLASIGGHFGKDHATVLHACKTINNLIDTDKIVKDKVNTYSKKIKHREEFENNIISDDIARIKEQLIQYLIEEKEIDHSAIILYNRLLHVLTINDPEIPAAEPTIEELNQAIEEAEQAIIIRLIQRQKIDFTAILSYNQLLGKAEIPAPT